MSIVQQVSPIHWIVATAPCTGRRPYTRPAVRDCGSLDELLHLRSVLVRCAPALFRLAQNGEFVVARTRHAGRGEQVRQDVGVLVAMLRALCLDRR